MSLSVPARQHLLGAAAAGLPFAVWRRPHAAGFTAAIACGGLQRRAVFKDVHEQPFFALARFDAGDANTCEAVPADILIEGETVRYFDGRSYGPAPASDVHAALAAHGQHGRLKASARSRPLPVETTQAAYRHLVGQAVSAIAEGRFRKVVLSRAEGRALPRDHDLFASLEALDDAYPSAFVALVDAGAAGAWIVATPETLLSVNGAQLETMALAGTQWPEDSTPLPSIVWPGKIIEEQRLVADYIREAFASSGISARENGPFTVRAANLCHLRSDFAADLAPGDHTRLPGLIRALHPTSAVCGMPKSGAMQFLREHEGYDRSYYTGYLGPVGVGGRVELFVNLRSARVSAGMLLLHVGGGIVEASDPELEWEETTRKTHTIAGVIFRDGAGSSRGADAFSFTKDDRIDR